VRREHNPGTEVPVYSGMKVPPALKTSQCRGAIHRALFFIAPSPQSRSDFHLE